MMHLVPAQMALGASDARWLIDGSGAKERSRCHGGIHYAFNAP